MNYKNILEKTLNTYPHNLEKVFKKIKFEFSDENKLKNAIAIRGEFNSEENAIYVYNKVHQTRFDLFFTIANELGHYFFLHLLSSNPKKDWIKKYSAVSDSLKKTVSGKYYSKEILEEIYSDLFAYETYIIRLEGENMATKKAAKEYQKDLNKEYKGLEKEVKNHIENYTHYCTEKDGERMKNTMKRILKLNTDDELEEHFKKTFDLD